jgi:hypothetical protein
LPAQAQINVTFVQGHYFHQLAPLYYTSQSRPTLEKAVGNFSSRPFFSTYNSSEHPCLSPGRERANFYFFL